MEGAKKDSALTSKLGIALVKTKSYLVLLMLLGSVGNPPMLVQEVFNPIVPGEFVANKRF